MEKLSGRFRSSSCYHYRHQNMPDDSMDVMDLVPIFPNPDTKKYKPFLRDYHREIAWTIDLRGENDNIPTLLFVGAGYTLVNKVFMQMFAHGSCLFTGFRLYEDHYIYQRQTKAWSRIAIELRGYKEDVLSLEQLGTNLANMMQRLCWCNIKQVKLDKFLNL